MAATLEMSFNFGRIDAARPEIGAAKRFRIALMGDFSGRAARGEVAIGPDLASRRPIKFDIDTIEKVIAGFATTLVLPIGRDGQGIEVKLGDLDSLHPDWLYENVEMFEGLVALKRRLSSAKTAKGAAEELKEWGQEHGQKVRPPAKRSRGNAVPANGRLTDFQRLVGGKAHREVEATAADDLIARVVGPYITPAVAADVSEMEEAVDAALSGAMRLVLHHPEFQSVEAQWRMLDLIARSVETDSSLEIVLYDISAEELAADLSAVEDLSKSGLCELLVESTPDGRGPFSAICGLYTFEETPAHAELLGRIARVSAHVNAPFFAAIGPGFLETPKDERLPAVAGAWDALRAMPEAGYVGLASPRFLLRRPYGAKTEPCYEFDFEEFTPEEGLPGMLWANPVALVAILLARSFRKNGPSLELGSVMQLGQVPFHFVTDSHGDQVALPATERNLTQSKVAVVLGRGLMPVIGVKGRDEVRLGSFQSLTGETILGPWTGLPPPKPTPASPPPRAAAAAPAAAAVAEEASGGDDDLDALLAGLDAGGDEAPPAEAAVDDELEALLASFGDDDLSGASPEAPAEDAGGDDDMDPELAALLASL